MATEGTWEVITDVIKSKVNPTDADITVSNQTDEASGDTSEVNNDFLESWATQKGSQYLYILKEQLKACGWTVVSSSARQNYVDPTNRDMIKNFLYDPDPLNTNITVNGFYKKNKNFFKCGAEDFWTPENGIGTPAGVNTEFINDGLTDGNPSYSVIYPGYVPDGEISTTEYRRSLNAGYFQTIKAIGGASPVSPEYVSLGRSWCLLKAPDSFAEAGTNARYHILLDYVNNNDTNIPFYNKLIPSTTFKTFESLTGYNSSFGSLINMYIFPDYGDNDKYTDLLDLSNVGTDPTKRYTPDQFKRPSHKYEIATIINSDTTAPVGVSGFYFLKSEQQSPVISNIIHDTTNGSLVILSSENQEIISQIIIGTIADGINPSITQNKSGYNPGTKFFSFWSWPQRGGTGLVGVTHNASIETKNNANYVLNLTNTIFDFAEARSHTF